MTYWELNDGRILRVEDSKKNDLVNDNPLLKAGCEAVLIKDERFTWLEMGGKYLADFTDTCDDLEFRVKQYCDCDEDYINAEEAEEYFTSTYGGGFFVRCWFNTFNNEHNCYLEYFESYDTEWWDATAWLVVPDGVDEIKLLNDYTLWMNGFEVQIFDNETGELITAVLSSDYHEKIVHDLYGEDARMREDI